ncbi:MAG: restriction endonuclease [Rikenellaceae bacterium]
MPIPKYNEMYRPMLEFLQTGETYAIKEVKPAMIKYFKLSSEDLSEVLPSSRQSVLDNRIGWCRTYLKKAGLVDSPARAMVRITEEGKAFLSKNNGIIDNQLLSKYEGFQKFIDTSRQKAAKDTSPTPLNEETPDDYFEGSFIKINERLADELISEVIKLSPKAFEEMVIDLLSKMGYGAFENAGKTTTYSGDEGIDGIIMEDKLGFNLIYIQAKKWDLSSCVGRPAIQNFVGAISGKGGKGLFVTTTRFSEHAIKYANDQHIILIDGNKLAKLMIEHNFGVSCKKIFEIKTIDSDLFNDYETQ